MVDFPLERRYPLYTRPLPFVVGWLLFLTGLSLGLNWVWKTDLFSGSILIQTLIPAQIVDFSKARTLWLIPGLLGLVALFFAFGSEEDVGRGGWRAPKWRFYPIAFTLGLFLLVYGLIWIFAVNIAADDLPGGLVVFTTLNYSGIAARVLIVVLGFALFVVGAAITARGSLDFSTGLERVRRAGVEASEISVAPSQAKAETQSWVPVMDSAEPAEVTIDAVVIDDDLVAPDAEAEPAQAKPKKAAPKAKKKSPKKKTAKKKGAKKKAAKKKGTKKKKSAKAASK